MLGAIIGDIIGSRWEFNPTNDYDFELFSDKNSFTDDTICTVAVADALLHGSGDYGKYIHNWCRKYPHPMGGYGGRFSQWVTNDNPTPYGSFGNGSAMRVSPIGWWFDNVEELLEQAGKTASCTHNHPEGIKGAQTVALAIHYAFSLQKKIEFGSKDGIKELMDYAVRFSGYNINIRKEQVYNRFDETCKGTVPVALWIINQSNGFEDAIRRAVSLGADADTLGAIVGSIAEAIWGIPMHLREKAESYLPEEMISIIKGFYNSEKLTKKRIAHFAQKYIYYFENEFGNTKSYYDFFDTSTFPNECWNLGFEMDCGHSFIKLYGESAWNSKEGLSAIIDKINDVKVAGASIFSKWRLFNHWSYTGATDDDKEWFLMLFRRLQQLVMPVNQPK